MIKIAFITPSTVGGGAERMQINIMHSLPKDKYDIYFINTGKQAKPEELCENINFIKYNKNSAKESFYLLYKDLKRIKPTYVFTTSIVVAYLLQIIRLFLRFKLIVRIAVPPSELRFKSFKSKILKLINSYTLSFSDLIIAQTQFSKDDIVKHYNVPRNKIKVIRNIVDKDLLDKKSDVGLPQEFNNNQFKILAVGALYSVKGFDLLIDAMKIVISKYPNTILYIIGEERYEVGYKSRLIDQINKNLLANNIFLLGQKENPYPYFKNANLFVLSSRKEGFPNVVLEALYLNTPVVATNCVDFSEVIIEGENGYIVEKENVNSLAEGICKSIDSLPQSTKFSLENFNYEKIFL